MLIFTFVRSSHILFLFADSLFSSEKETEIGRLQDKDQEKSLLFDKTARIAKENAEGIRTWERLYNEAVDSHKAEVEKLDSRLTGK